jgi:tetratricopeptide (TPR) repeat protein
MSYDFHSENPVSEKQIKALNSKVKWKPNTQIEAWSIAARAEQFLNNEEYGKGLQALNLRLSLNNAVYKWDPDQQKQAKILNSIAEGFYKANEYKEAIEVANKARSLTPELSMIAARSSLILMKGYFKMKQHQASGKCFSAAKQACEWSVGEMHPFRIELDCALADLFYEEQDYEMAASYLDKSLKSGKMSLGNKHSLVAMLQSKTGILLANRGDSKNATVLLQTALEYFEKFGDVDDMVASAANMYFSLAEVTAQNGKFEDAMVSAAKALESRLRVRSAGHADVLESYVQVARLYESQGEIEKAVENYERALSSLKKQRGEKEVVVQVQRLSRKVLSLLVRNQPLSMRLMLQSDPMLHHPALAPGSRTQQDTMDYVLRMLFHVTAPSKYLKALLDFVTAVEGDKEQLLKLPDSETFEGAVPPPAAQLACLAGLAAEGESDGEKENKKGEDNGDSAGGAGLVPTASDYAKLQKGKGGGSGGGGSGGIAGGGSSGEFDALRMSFAL